MRNKILIVFISFFTLFMLVGCDKKDNNENSFVGDYKLYELSDNSKTYTAKEVKKTNNAVITLEVRDNNIMILKTDYLDDETEDKTVEYVYDEDNFIYLAGNMIMNFEFTDGKIIIKSTNYTYTFKK